MMGSAIQNLLGLASKTARKIETDGTARDVPLESVPVGDSLRVRPGDVFPVDGECSKPSAPSVCCTRSRPAA
jgi:P-type Cu+ transporter